MPYLFYRRKATKSKSFKSLFQKREYLVNRYYSVVQETNFRNPMSKNGFHKRFIANYFLEKIVFIIILLFGVCRIPPNNHSRSHIRCIYTQQNASLRSLYTDVVLFFFSFFSKTFPQHYPLVLAVNKFPRGFCF